MNLKSISNIYTNLNNIGKILLFIILLLITISLCKIVLNDKKSTNMIEGLEINNGSFHNNNMYDKFYASIYDFIAFDNDKNVFEIKKIIELTSPNMNSTILDIGSGLGHHVNALNENYCGNIIGIDKSQDMIDYSKLLYPDISASFHNIDITTENVMPNQYVSHILCLYFTIYYIQDQKQFLQKCFNMLQNNGYMILHLVNINEIETLFRPDYVNKISDNHNPKTTIEFNKFQYTSNFDTSFDNKRVLFKENFAFKDGKKRTHEHSLFMNDQEIILQYARSVGFIIEGKVNMSDCNYENHFIYILKKPF